MENNYVLSTVDVDKINVLKILGSELDVEREINLLNRIDRLRAIVYDIRGKAVYSAEEFIIIRT